MTPLSSSDLDRLSSVQRVILSPLTYPAIDGWMQAVNDGLKRLFSAEQAIFLLTLPTGPKLISDLSQQAVASYFEHYALKDDAPVMLEQLPDPFAVAEDAEALPLFARYAASEAYNEWYRPLGMDRTISLRAYGRPDGVPTLAPRWPETLMANAILGSSSTARGKKASAARTMLALLQPALAAGVRTVQQAHGVKPTDLAAQHLSAVIDGLEAPLWLFDESGRCVHQSAAAARLVGRLAQGDLLRASVEHLAKAMLRSSRRGEPAPSTWALEVSGERIGLSGTYLGAADPLAPAVVVRAEGVLAMLPSVGALQERFGLTPQEARVALLRARGEATTAIAERLAVSVHTVRRHTERAMAKLEVHRAAEIGPQLLALS